MIVQQDRLTANEASILSGVPVRTVYKLARERLPRDAVSRKSGRLFLTVTGAVCVRLDGELPKDIPLRVRRALYRMVKPHSERRIEYGAGALRYVLETKEAASSVSRRLAIYRRELALITEDPRIQGGAATFKGTRILVHHIADLLAQGVPAQELKADYPHLTDAMLAAAPTYVRVHPKRGRPKLPRWRQKKPSVERRSARTPA